MAFSLAYFSMFLRAFPLKGPGIFLSSAVASTDQRSLFCALLALFWTTVVLVSCPEKISSK